MKNLFKIVGRVLLAFIAFVLLYLTSAYFLSRITINKDVINYAEVPIYIKTNGVHTDIVVPVKNQQTDWSKEVAYSNTMLADSSYHYLAMGWGDKGFYLETPDWSDLKFSVAFNAAFGLGSTAIHATYYKILKKDSTCKEIWIDRHQYEALIKYILKSFTHDAKGHFIPIKTNANYGDTDAFYEANGSYSMFHTCNTWANDGLNACNQRCCLWTPFDTGIFLKYK
ncbi:MAG: TIGR02117 family protein [Bacteroidia bacterium]